MSILTLFVVIPALMLLGLWLAKSLNQVRGVMVVGASCLLALSVWLTIYFVQQRAAGNTDVMLLTASTPWFKPLNIAYSVGVDGISVVMLLLSSIIVFTGTFASWQLKPMTKEYFLWFTLLSTGVYGFFILGIWQQGICCHETDSDADGRLGPADYRYFGYLLLQRGNDYEC